MIQWIMGSSMMQIRRLTYTVTLIHIGKVAPLIGVDVFVTSEDILVYIIIVCCCTPIGDVCYPSTGCLNCV